MFMSLRNSKNLVENINKGNLNNLNGVNQFEGKLPLLLHF